MHFQQVIRNAECSNGKESKVHREQFNHHYLMQENLGIVGALGFFYQLFFVSSI